MKFSRRYLLSAGGVLLVSCGGRGSSPQRQNPSRLDALLVAHRDVLPENGGGANHYPMVAEALAALGREDAIEDAWIRDAKLYAGALPRVARLDDPMEALGSYARFGDLLDAFRRELALHPWREVVSTWTPRLAPGISAAAFHGVIRTGHAARSLQRSDSEARRNELAVGLAYWVSRYRELPASPTVSDDGTNLRPLVERPHHPWLDDRSDVDFAKVGDRLTQADTPVAPAVASRASPTPPATSLRELVGVAAAGVLEMLVRERNRLWLMHTVTGPAAVDLLLPHVDEDGAARLVAFARQAVIAMFAAYGEPFVSRAHMRSEPPSWSTLIDRAVASRSVHTIKLTEALVRLDSGDDPLCRSTAAQWLDWV